MCRVPLSYRYIDSCRNNECSKNKQDYVSGFLHNYFLTINFAPTQMHNTSPRIIRMIDASGPKEPPVSNSGPEVTELRILSTVALGFMMCAMPNTTAEISKATLRPYTTRTEQKFRLWQPSSAHPKGNRYQYASGTFAQTAPLSFGPHNFRQAICTSVVIVLLILSLKNLKTNYSLCNTPVMTQTNMQSEKG